MTADQLRQTVRAILLNDWDPIGISGIREIADEYDHYIAGIAQMAVAGKSTADLAEHLVRIEVDRMGLDGDHDRARVVAAKLRKLAQTLSN